MIKRRRVKFCGPTAWTGLFEGTVGAIARPPIDHPSPRSAFRDSPRRRLARPRPGGRSVPVLRAFGSRGRLNDARRGQSAHLSVEDSRRVDRPSPLVSVGLRWRAVGWHGSPLRRPSPGPSPVRSLPRRRGSNSRVRSGSIAARAVSRRSASSIAMGPRRRIHHLGVGLKAKPDATGSDARCACRRPDGRRAYPTPFGARAQPRAVGLH